MILHVHKEMTDKLNKADIGNQFLSSSNNRENRFGKSFPIKAFPGTMKWADRE